MKTAQRSVFRTCLNVRRTGTQTDIAYPITSAIYFSKPLQCSANLSVSKLRTLESCFICFQQCENIWESTNDDVETIGKRYLKGEVTCVSLTFAWFIKLSHSFFFFLSLFVFVACLCGSPSAINFQLRFKALNFILVKFGQGKRPTCPLQFSFTGHHILPQYTILAIIWRVVVWISVGRDNSVGIANRCGPDGPGIESRWGRGFPPTSRPALRPTQPRIQWVPDLSRG